MISIEKITEAEEMKNLRRVKKYILVYVSTGSVDIKIGDKDFTLCADEIITITPGQFHFIKELNSVKGFVIEFTYHFFIKDDGCRINISKRVILPFYINEIINASNHKIIFLYLNEINSGLTHKPFQYLSSIHSKLKLILIEIDRTRKKLESGYELLETGSIIPEIS